MPVHILIVDDDQAIREVLRMVLEDEGYLITEAPDGIQAIEQLRATSFAFIVITDHQMPHLDGPGLLKVILHDERLINRHRFIYFTAMEHSISQAVVDILEYLAAPIVRKPFDVDVMVQTVAALAEQMPNT